MMPSHAPIPVHISRHTDPLPPKYGALIHWEIGEEVTVISSSNRPPIQGIIKSDMLWHDKAPVVESARGPGQWIYEVEIKGELYTISPWQLEFPAKKELVEVAV